MISRKLWLLAACIASAWGDVKFLTPAAGSSQSSLTLSITWEDSGASPALSKLNTYQMYLCAGGNHIDSYADLTELVTSGKFSDGYSATATVPTGLGANVENAYFIKMVSVGTSGSVVNFSDRFSLTGMTGTFSDEVTAGLRTVTGTAGPSSINNVVVVNRAADDDTTTDVDLYTVAYTLQTGSIRYAPMPPMPSTSITASSASAQYATSAYTLYTTYGGAPDASTTYTLAQTFSTSSREATQSAASQPTDAMQKFLHRWKD